MMRFFKTPPAFILLLALNFYSLQSHSFGLGYGAIQVPHYYGSGEYFELVSPFPLFGPLEWEKVKKRDKMFYFDGAGDFRLAVNPESTSVPEPAGFTDPNSRITGFRNYSRRGMSHVPASLYLGFKIGIAFSDFLFFEYAYTPGVNLGSGWGHAGVQKTASLNWILFADTDKYLSLEFEAIEGNDQYHEQYYEVKASDAITGRAQYNASVSGHSVYTAGFYYYQFFGQILVIAGMEYYDMNQSVVKDSPLVRAKTGGLAGAGFAINF